MRTTLTLEPDVAARLKQLKQSQSTFKDLVNTALRHGLDFLESERRSDREPFSSPLLPVGRPLIDISSTSEALAYAEGEDFR